MIQKLHMPVSVVSYFDHRSRKVSPTLLFWEGKRYMIQRIGFRHSYRCGRTLYHVFSVVAYASSAPRIKPLGSAVVAGSIFFRLSLDSETLFWYLEEVSDGLPS